MPRVSKRPQINPKDRINPGVPSHYAAAMDDIRRNPPNARKKNPRGLCGAKLRNGKRCGQIKGWGTSHYGFGPCKFHGGSVPAQTRKLAKERAILMGAPKEINPVDALYWCIRITAGEVEFLSEQIAKIDKEDWYEHTVLGRQMHILVRERKEATERLARFSKDAISLGLAERAVRLAENFGIALARLLAGIAGELELTRDQAERWPTIIRRQLILLEGRAPINAEERDLLAIPEKVGV